MIRRFAESNIPVEYWDLSMSEFKGSEKLLKYYNGITEDLKRFYGSGMSFCFAGNHGTGKSTCAANVLKQAAIKGYSCLYTTLSDIVSVLTSYGQDTALARKELITVDFLVIDEFDPRFMGTDNAAELFGRTLENVFRTRSQNKMPTLMCTNSPNVVESFQGAIRQTIESLMRGYVKNVVVLGDDFRKIKQSLASGSEK